MKTKIICLIVTLLSISVVFAEELMNPGITPDNPFYGLDRALERIRLMLTLNKEAKIKLRLMLAEERLAEAKVMAEANKIKLSEELVKEHEKEIETIENEIKEAEERGINVTELVELVSNVTYKHVLVLQEVLERVPEQAKPSIEHAISVSLKGHLTASEKIAGIDPERGLRLHLEYANKIMEMVREGRGKPEILLEHYQREMNKTEELLEKLEKRGFNVTKVVTTIAEATSMHEEVLQKVYETVPEEAKGSVEKAMEVSKKGKEKAVEAITRGRECETDEDCRHIICPQVIGMDTPMCKEGICICGPGEKEIPTEEVGTKVFKEEKVTPKVPTE